jgi:GAF domain-containing protein
MSVATHLKMISTFDRWAHGHEPISALLKEALGYIQEDVSEALSLRLYHLNESGVLLGASTASPRDSQIFITVSDQSAHTSALAHRQPTFDARRSTWLAPLESDNTTFGLLEVSVNGSAEETLPARDWIALVAAHVAQALDRRTLQDLSRKQVQTSSALTHATTYIEIAGILARNLLHEKQFTSINLFVYDGSGEFNGFRTIATANRKDVFDTEAGMEGITLEDMGLPFSRILEEARPFLIADVATNATMSERVKAWLQSYEVKGVCLFPMRSQGRTFGFIAINSATAPLYLAEAEMTAYQSLADQVSTLVQLGHVSERVDFTLAISERQKRAFNELVAGQDFPEMAGIIARHMLPDRGRYLIISELVYDAQGALIEWRPLASANREKSYRSTGEPSPVPLAALAAPALLSVRDGEIFTADASRNLEQQVGAGFANWMRENHLRHYVSLPILLNERSIALLQVFSRNEQGFSREEINAFSNITGQMGALVQVRYLLDQARNARQLVDSLVLANRLVSVARDPGHMAQSVTYTLARNMKGAAISLFDQPVAEGSVPRYRQIIGFSSPEEIYPVDASARLNDLPDADQIRRLLAGQPVIVDDLAETRDVYRSIGANRMTSFGLRSGDQLLGTLDLLDDQPFSFTSEEIDTYATLADQIGIMLRSRQLIAESQEAQAVAAQLVQTNLQISTAQNYDDMAQAIVRNLPETVTTAVILLFNEPLGINEIPRWIKLEVVATRDEVEHPEIIDYVAQEGDVLHSQGLQSILGGEMLLVEDSRSFPFRVIHNTIEYFQQRDIYSFIATGLRAGTRFLGLMALGAKDFLAIGDLQRENLRAIASQVAVAIENRILINQTADALSFVGLQYEVSNALYRAQEPGRMLSALFQFVKEYFTQARLGMIDHNSAAARIVVEINAEGDTSSAVRRTGALYSTPVTRTVLMQDHIIVSDDGRTLTLPLVTTGEQLIGVVQFLNEHEAVVLPLDVVRALRSLADQMTTNLQNYDLLRQMEEGLEETRTLYEANRALLNAGNVLEALKVLYNSIAKDADYISLVSLGHDVITEELVSYQLEAVITPQDAQWLEQPLEEMIGAEQLSQIRDAWREKGDEIEFAENAQQVAVMRPLLDFYKDRNVQIESNIAMPVFEDGMLTQVINVSFSQARVFDNPTRRLYAAVRDQIAIVLQNQRLINDTRLNAAQLGSQVRVLQTLNHFALNLSGSRDEKALLDEACKAFHAALRLDHVGITLLNPDGLSATVVADYPSYNLVGLQIEDTNELQVKIRTSRDVIYLPDVANAEGLAEVSRRELSRLGLQTMLLVPILDNKDTYMGAAGLEFYQQGHEFTGEMIDIARTIAAQTAIGLQNLREVAKTQRQAQQLQHLARFSQTLQTQFDLASVFDTLVAQAPDILYLDHLSVMLYDSVSNTLRLTLQYNNGTVYKMTGSTPITDGTTAGRAWKQRDLIYVAQLRHERDLAHTFNSQMLSTAAAPIFARGSALGVIEISSQNPYAYNETDLIVFRQFVSQVGVAMENAETYMQSQRLARSKALVNEISSQIQKQVDLESILNVTVSELGRALGAKQARVRLGTQDEDGEKSEQW